MSPAGGGVDIAGKRCFRWEASPPGEFRVRQTPDILQVYYLAIVYRRCQAGGGRGWRGNCISKWRSSPRSPLRCWGCRGSGERHTSKPPAPWPAGSQSAAATACIRSRPTIDPAGPFSERRRRVLPCTPRDFRPQGGGADAGARQESETAPLGYPVRAAPKRPSRAPSTRDLRAPPEVSGAGGPEVPHSRRSPKGPFGGASRPGTGSESPIWRRQGGRLTNLTCAPRTLSV